MIRINLLPVRQLKKQALLRQQLYIFGAIIATVSIGVGAVWIMDRQAMAQLEAEQAALRANLERLKPIVDEVNTLERREKLLNARMETIQRLRSNQRGPVHVLDALSQNLPEQAWLETIDESAGVYKVAGYALTNFAVADLLRNLQRSKEFIGVDLISSEQVVIAGREIKKFIIQFQRAAGAVKPDAHAVDSATETWRMNSLLEKLEALEPKQRWMICGLAVVLLAGIGYYLHSMNAESFETLSLAVEEMRQSVQKHQAIAIRLDELKARLVALDEALKVAITLLPETREIPELLTQISQLGLQCRPRISALQARARETRRLLRGSPGEPVNPGVVPRPGTLFRPPLQALAHRQRHGYQDQPGQGEWGGLHPHDQLSLNHLPISGTPGSCR